MMIMHEVPIYTWGSLGAYMGWAHRNKTGKPEYRYLMIYYASPSLLHS